VCPCVRTITFERNYLLHAVHLDSISRSYMKVKVMGQSSLSEDEKSTVVTHCKANKPTLAKKQT